ncbi:ankyrin repeat-containing domain protein [Mycena polygramma]|nr:ankyrin repeat-containing domain protein [Mycena polygramma]
MARFLDLPPELVLHIASFLTGPHWGIPDLPDLRSVNALAQANTVFHQTLNQTLYDLCASVNLLARLAILYAVKHELLSTVDRLVAVGISLDQQFRFEDDLCSPLYIAASMGLRDMVVKLLVMHGEEMATRAYARRNSSNATPLDIAARNEHMDIVTLLAPIPSPAVPVPTPGGDSDDMALDSPVLTETEARRQYLSLALTQSVVAGNIEICEYLISEGADVNFFERLQSRVAPPLYYAANLSTVQFLLASGADPNIHDGDLIPLFNAACISNLDMIQALLDGGADINVRGSLSDNVLAWCGTVKVLRFCLERGADPNAAAHGAQTQLHRACAIDDAEFATASVELLLQFGAGSVDKLDFWGSSPVDIAMAKGLVKVVEILEPLVQNPSIRMNITLWREDRGLSVR